MRKEMIQNSILSIAGRILGFLIPFVIAYYYGLSRATDAFFFIFGFILLAQMILGSLFEIALVPFLSREIKNSENVYTLLGPITFWATLAILAITFTLALSIKFFLPLVSSFDLPTLELCHRLLLEMLPMLLCLTWISICHGTLIALKKFSLPALSPGIRSVIVIASIVFFSQEHGIHAVSLGYTVGEAVRLFILLIYLFFALGTPKGFPLRSEKVKEFYSSASLQTLGLALLSSLSLINQAMASWVGPGAVSLFSYGERLRNIPLLVFTAGVVPVIFSYWSSEGEQQWKKQRKTILQLALGAIAVSAVLILLRVPLTQLMVGNGNFPQARVESVATIFAILIGGFAFDVIAVLCVRLYMIQNKNLVYVFFALIRVLLAIGVNGFFLTFWGVEGIAYSMILVGAFYCALLFLNLQRGLKT